MLLVGRRVTLAQAQVEVREMKRAGVWRAEVSVVPRCRGRLKLRVVAKLLALVGRRASSIQLVERPVHPHQPA